MPRIDWSRDDVMKILENCKLKIISQEEAAKQISAVSGVKNHRSAVSRKLSGTPSQRGTSTFKRNDKENEKVIFFAFQNCIFYKNLEICAIFSRRAPTPRYRRR